MGNQVVIPSFKDWYTSPLRKRYRAGIERLANCHAAQAKFLQTKQFGNRGHAAGGKRRLRVPGPDHGPVRAGPGDVPAVQQLPAPA